MPNSESASEELHRAWKSLLPSGVMTQTLPIADYCDLLADGELAYIAKAAERRKKEFSTSRKAIRDLIHSQCEAWEGVIPDSRHMPVWPEGWVGSISHSKGICSVAIVRSNNLSSIGIDLESLNRIRSELWRKIVSEEETSAIQAHAVQTERSVDDLMTVVFSIKEAFYKYQFPKTGLWLGFLDVHLNFSPEQTISISLRPDLPQDIAEGIKIVYRITSNHVISTVYRLTE